MLGVVLELGTVVADKTEIGSLGHKSFVELGVFGVGLRMARRATHQNRRVHPLLLHIYLVATGTVGILTGLGLRDKNQGGPYRQAYRYGNSQNTPSKDR
jgi:hypothetical protein